MTTFESPDLSGFVFARKQLLAHPTSEVSIDCFAQTWNINSSSLEDLWNLVWKQSLIQTRFGRIGIMYDHHDIDAHTWAQTEKCVSEYAPTEPKRAKKEPEIHLLPTQALSFLANEGLSDTVEFRRLARRQLRSLKQANIDTLILCDPILAEEKTQKILQHIASSKIKILTPLHVFEPPVSKSIRQSISVNAKTKSGWINKRGSSILRQKIKGA